MKKSSIFEQLKQKICNLLDGLRPTQRSTTSKYKARETYVYVTLKGEKFHYDILCPRIRNSKEIKMTLSKARKAGYTACDKCCYEYLHD